MDPKLEKKRLFEAVYIESETVEQAQEILIKARRKVGLGPSVITSIVVGTVHFAWTRTIDTFAVKLTGDGNAMLMVNPDFAIKIGPDQCVFALVHEAYHLLLVHLYVDPALMQNPNWVTATEACINYRITKHLGLPLITIDGKVAIVDPASVYDRWRKAMQTANLPVVSKDQFFDTDLGCFSYLEQCPKEIPPYGRGQKPGKGEGGCVHANDHGDQNGGGKPAPLDPTEVNKFMEKVLGQSVQAAKNGRKGAKEEILNWMDASPEASKMWGDVGAGTLRGETPRTSKSDMWERWTADAMSSRLAEGTRWQFNKRITFEERISPIGRETKKHGSVYIDASGSMSQSFLDKVVALVGELENIEIQWNSFDGEVWPFVPGEGLRGGGGTSFQIIDDHVAQLDEEQDFVLVITDGYAPHIQPRDPDKWIWLVTPGGDTWAQDAGMLCREVDLDN